MMPTSLKLSALAGAMLLLSGCGLFGSPQPLFTATGTVTGADGQPVPGAVVSDGQVGVLTDENGRYAIALFDKHLTVLKPGYARASLQAVENEANTVHLSADAAAPRVGIDQRGEGMSLTGLRSYLNSVGFKTQAYTGASPDDLDALILTTPGALNSQELERLRNWVHDGGRLVLLGEWGGFPSQDLSTMNALAEDAGITFTGATVKEGEPDGTDSEWLSLDSVTPPSLGKLVGEGNLQLYTTTSLSLQAPARPILSSSANSYSVLSRMAPQVLGAVGASAKGKVFALGDSSMWLDLDSGDQGTPNWQRGANRELASALLKW